MRVQKKINWRDKLQPIFNELAELNRQFEIELARIQLERKKVLKTLGSRAPADLRAEQMRRFEEKINELYNQMSWKLVEIDRRFGSHAYNPVAYSYFDFANEEPDKEFPAYLHWLRHRESLQTTVARDNEGDIAAYRKLTRTGEDLRRIAHKKGPIKPFQGDVIHRQLLELILCYEIKPLTAEERAECMDHYCSCGKTHDADALKKQWARLKKELQASAHAPTAANSPISPQDAE